MMGRRSTSEYSYIPSFARVANKGFFVCVSEVVADEVFSAPEGEVAVSTLVLSLLLRHDHPARGERINEYQ